MTLTRLGLSFLLDLLYSYRASAYAYNTRHNAACSPSPRGISCKAREKRGAGQSHNTMHTGGDEVDLVLSE